MHSQAVCAISGSFLLFGGWAGVIWVFLRALSLHLQICWELVPGKGFFYSALIFGLVIPAVGIALALGLTGVSYRFGNVCHINHKDGLQDFWGPLLAFAALAAVLQFVTLGYCVQVYMKSLFDDKANTTDTGSSLPRYNASVSTMSARRTYRRVKRIVELQWRGATVVLLIVGEIIFFAVVFVSMDNSTQLNADYIQKATPWLECLTNPALTTNAEKRAKCLPLASGLVQSERVVLAVLIVLGFSGVWVFIFLGRWSMFLGWVDLVKRRMTPHNEFVSAKARRLSDTRTYEQLSNKPTPLLDLKSPDKAVMSRVSGKTDSPMSPEDSKRDYFDKTGRNYMSPISSYSTPRPPSAQQNVGMTGRGWDSNATHAKSGMPGVGTAITKDFGM